VEPLVGTAAAISALVKMHIRSSVSGVLELFTGIECLQTIKPPGERGAGDLGPGQDYILAS